MKKQNSPLLARHVEMREEGGTGRFLVLGNKAPVGQEDVGILSDQSQHSQSV
jgi:hypothetical protein